MDAEKKKLPLDGAALEDRELQLAELATGWGPSAPLWLTLELIRRRPLFFLRLAALQSIPLWSLFLLTGIGLVPVVLAGLAFPFVALVGPGVTLGVPGSVLRDLRHSDQATDGELMDSLQHGLPGALQQALGEYHFHLSEVGVAGCGLLFTPVALAFWWTALVPLPNPWIRELLWLAGLLSWLTVVGIALLSRVVVPFLLSMPAQLLGYPGELAQRRTRSITEANGGSLVLFAAPLVLAGGAGVFLALELLGVAGELAVLVLAPPLLHLASDVFLGVWTYRFLFELHEERERRALPPPS